jgi:hypothetical protein
MKSLTIESHQPGGNTFAIEMADSRSQRVLTGTAKTITVPTGARYAVFSATDDVWVNTAATAIIPSGDSDADLSELNPAVRLVTPGQSISVIGNCTVTVGFYG